MAGKAVIVGAGIAGLTAAVLLRRAGWRGIEIYETRKHIAGLCHDAEQEGVWLQTYGPHILHTDSQKVWKFLNLFTRFNGYVHRVMNRLTDGRFISFPYNKKTEQQLGKSLTDQEIIELIFKSYSEKMWGMPFGAIPQEILKRVPARRDNDDDRFSTKRFQGVPIHGWSQMCRNMLMTSGARIFLGAAPTAWEKSKPRDLLVYTGSPDQYFNYCHGPLPYRNLVFHYSIEANDAPAAIIYDCDAATKYTRKTYYARFYKETEKFEMTPVTVEEPGGMETGLPIYPLRHGENIGLFERYRELMEKTDVLFCGRFGAYRYMDIDHVVLQVMGALNARGIF